jgi:hypothetical protein
VTRVATAVLAALTLGMSDGADAQDSVRCRWRSESFVGSTRLTIDASFQRQALGGIPVTAYSEGTIIFAPFVGERWQIGIEPTWQYESQQSNTSYAGALGVFANYLLPGGEVSRTYVGAFFSEAGSTHAKGFSSWGGQAGWLHFLSPAIALRAELIWRRSPAFTRSDAIVTLNPYLFGRANGRLTTSSLGVFDVAVEADMELTPERSGFLNSTIAPFLTDWLQIGASEQLTFLFSENEGVHDLEAFGRGYLPVSTREMPFAELFTHSSFVTQEPTTRSHGERAGVRTYLAPGVALDVAYQWRDYGVQHLGSRSVRLPEDRLLHIGLLTQFRVVRR